MSWDIDEPTYESANAAMLRNYHKAVGDALALKIKVYTIYRGTLYMKGLGDLRDEIADAQGHQRSLFGTRRFDDVV